MEFIYNKKLNLKISRIGFGGIPIQNSSVENAKDVVDELIRSNVNYIDSARGYKESEKIIGEAIKGRRSSFILATKSMARTYEAMKKDIEVSLGNFQTDYIDIYQLHNPNMEALELCLSDEGAYRALKEAKSEGKIGHIGITNHSLEVLNKAIDTGLFETVMYPFNIVEDQGKEMFNRCKSLGILTIAMKPVAGGAIDNKKLAIKYLLNEDIDVIIPGMKDKNEVIENV
ncbi:MAG: aldo/keto reductase, partial [Bacilli bacterium]|nr:aldo/keto reductase [Bacilli bacterium]